MKCYVCETDARALCKFCGRAVCIQHSKTATHYTGYGAKNSEALISFSSKTGVIVQDAIWCGICKVEYVKTW